MKRGKPSVVGVLQLSYVREHLHDDLKAMESWTVMHVSLILVILTVALVIAGLPG